jgi:hypothetical protein
VATSLSRNGVEDTLIFRILGWETPSMFGKHYYAPNTADLHRAILKLYTDAPLKRQHEQQAQEDIVRERPH